MSDSFFVLRSEFQKYQRKMACSMSNLRKISNVPSTGTSYDLTSADNGKVILADNASANTITVPLDATSSIPIGAEIVVVQYGAGATTISPEAGVTIDSAGGLLSLGAQFGAVTLIKIDTDEWLLIGNLA